MSNNYLQFSTGINITADEKAWLENQLDEDVLGDMVSLHNPETSGLSPEQLDELKKKTLPDQSEMALFDNYAEMGWIGFDVEFCPASDPKDGKDWIMYIGTEESGDPDQVAELMGAFLLHFQSKDSFSLEWAYYSSKNRMDEQGGGAVFVTATSTQWINTGMWVHQRQMEHDKAQGK
ncbi:hypothetical protein CMI47_10280 [Candidatus Pacearchaeota archaeon]|nr:hypothetical protein [Candidatus Pacearchaeota archaeon]|tara:strand:+ start:3273 stop:3803 length:531 start_codon:yes stop_codon:yes gene_type:complete